MKPESMKEDEFFRLAMTFVSKGGFLTATQNLDPEQVWQWIVARDRALVEKLELLVEKHKEQACKIADVSDYDPVNMTQFVRNSIVSTLVFHHMDVVRELSDLLTNETK